VPQVFTRAFDRGVNPLSTLDQYASSLSAVEDPKGIICNALNRIAQAP
jgi:hypothetical protein